MLLVHSVQRFGDSHFTNWSGGTHGLCMWNFVTPLLISYFAYEELAYEKERRGSNLKKLGAKLGTVTQARWRSDRSRFGCCHLRRHRLELVPSVPIGQLADLPLTSRRDPTSLCSFCDKPIKGASCMLLYHGEDMGPWEDSLSVKVLQTPLWRSKNYLK